MTSETAIPAAALDRARVFSGAKAAVFFGSQMAVLLRDDRPDIPYPDMWDLPGGGRDPGESAVDCVIREAQEELALDLAPCDLHYGAMHESSGGEEVWFFAAHLAPGRAADLRLGDEGQAWQLMSAEAFLSHPRHIPTLGARLRLYLGWQARGRLG